MSLKRLGMVSYSPSIVTMAISVAICDIFSVKEWCDLEICSKVIKDSAIRQNTYDFLLVFRRKFGRISYRFCATVDFVPK